MMMTTLRKQTKTEEQRSELGCSPMNDKNLTIIEHIDELRKRLMVIVVFFIVAIIGSFFLAKPLINFLQVQWGSKKHYVELHLM